MSYDAGSKTVTVSKAGAEVKVTVGKPEVIINGESRPLDVPPIMYQGTVLVPVRVISEGMGAYVLWVPDNAVSSSFGTFRRPRRRRRLRRRRRRRRRLRPRRRWRLPYHDLYVAGDYIISPKVYNEFIPGTTACNTCNGFSYRLHGAVEFDLLNLPWMVEGDYRQYNYQHPNGFVDRLSARRSAAAAFVPAFNARDYDLDARVGLRVLQPRIYIGVGYLWRGNNYGLSERKRGRIRPRKTAGSRIGRSRSTGARTTTRSVKGNDRAVPRLGYDILKYDLGVSYAFQGIPLFVEGGFLGEHGWATDSSPSGYSEAGPYVGIGVKF